MAPVMKKFVAKAADPMKPKKGIKKNTEPKKAGSVVMKKPAVLNKKNLQQLDLDPASVSQSLNDKIVQFEKKPMDINSWLGKLSKQEREACWKRFEYDRKATPGAEEAYQVAATGKRSMTVKLDLLKTFLQNKSSCKGAAMQNAFLNYGVTIGQKSKESWRPFVYMANYYGVSELFRRVKDGSILARKDGNEWEFKLVQTTSYKDEQNSGGYSGTSQAKLCDEKWQDLQAAAHQLNLATDDNSNQSSGVLKFLQDKSASTSKKALSDGSGVLLPQKTNRFSDKDLVEADQLSDLGTIGKKAKERVISALSLLQKVSSQTTDSDYKFMLGNHIKSLKKFKEGKVTVEDIKDKLIKAMQCVKKAKAINEQ